MDTCHDKAKHFLVKQWQKTFLLDKHLKNLKRKAKNVLVEISRCAFRQIKMDVLFYCSYGFGFGVAMYYFWKIFKAESLHQHLCKNIVSLDYGLDHLVESRLLRADTECIATMKVTSPQCAVIVCAPLVRDVRGALMVFLTDKFLGTKKDQAFWSMLVADRSLKITCEIANPATVCTGAILMEQLKKDFDFHIQLVQQRRYFNMQLPLQNRTVYLKGKYIQNKFVYHSIGLCCHEFRPPSKVDMLLCGVGLCIMLCSFLFATQWD